MEDRSLCEVLIVTAKSTGIGGSGRKRLRHSENERTFFLSFDLGKDQQKVAYDFLHQLPKGVRSALLRGVLHDLATAPDEERYDRIGRLVTNGRRKNWKPPVALLASADAKQGTGRDEVGSGVASVAEEEIPSPAAPRQKPSASLVGGPGWSNSGAQKT